MTVLTFPSSPTQGQQYDAPNGIQYVFDGVKWVVETVTNTSEAISNSVQDRVAPMFVNGESNGITFEYDSETNTFTSTITNATGYVLPTATGSVLGGVKVGSGLTIIDSVLSANTPTPNQTLNTTDNVTFAQVETASLNQNSSVTVSPNSVNVPGATPTVVFSASGALTSIKLVIAAEGRLDGDVTNVDHTQTCEATIAATYNTTAEPIMSVYGVVYTSSTPLATFTVARNAGNIEVTAVNSQTTNALNVRVHAIQFVSRYD